MGRAAGSLRALALAAVAAFGLAACGDPGGACTTAEDCGEGQICLDGACRDVSVGDGDADADVDEARDGEPCETRCGGACCDATERCFRERCIPDRGECDHDGVCQEDSSCVDGVCVPFGVDPVADHDEACRREPEPLESFEPEVQCEWPGAFEVEEPGSTSVRVPPLVADLDGDDVPEIIFVTWTYPGGASPWPSLVRAIRGDDCSPVWTSSHSADPNQALVLADLTGDGLPEVCGRGSVYAGDAVPYCLSPDGSLLWEGHDEAGAAVPVAPSHNEVGLAAANVDCEGPPELVAGLAVFDGPTGLLRGDAPSAIGQVAYWSSIIPALADVDGDRHVEAFTGRGVVDLVTFEQEDWGTAFGYTALAELSSEHEGPEVVSVSGDSSRIRVQALDATVLFDAPVPGGAGGAPTVADLDGDGRAEISTAGQHYLTAFDLDCVGTPAEPPDPAFCAAEGRIDGVLWSVETHEYSSGITGSSVFDFEGDGAVEVVYADECWARVFDGRTGAVKFSAPHESTTGIEYPVVADADGDFYTEIVVPHEAYPTGCPAEDPLAPGVVREAGRAYRGITVFRDRTDRWAPSRPLWGQHAEHFDQLLDDGTVPLVEEPSWLGHNSYRRALPRSGGTAIDTPDLTTTEVDAPPCLETELVQPLSARVCNRGTLPVAPGVAVEFRLGSPDGETVCTTETSETLEPAECERVTCDWLEVPFGEPHVVYAVVDPDEGTVSECHEDNNTASLEVVCPPSVS